jgi:transcriptional regulator of met regulon
MATSCCEAGDVTPVPPGGGTLFGVKRVAMTVLLAALGCGASEAEIQQRFNDYVANANQCTLASDCAAASAGCPLGCEVAVRKERVADVEAMARKLIKEYESGGQSCIYGCRAREGVGCVLDRCTILYQPQPDAGASE